MNFKRGDGGAYLSFGDISCSRFWISFKLMSINWRRWWLSFAPTYIGTTCGIHVGLPFITVLGHFRPTPILRNDDV